MDYRLMETIYEIANKNKRKTIRNKRLTL
jgi:hypothetical protein